MISAAIAAPARGGRVVFSLDENGQALSTLTPSQITVYIAALEPLPADTLRTRQKAQVLAWLLEHGQRAGSTQQHEPIQLASTDLGKPYWPNSPWQLNYSHSQHYVALAIAPRVLPHSFACENSRAALSTHSALEGALGVDIELLGRARARDALVTRYYHPHEHVHASNELGFLTVWTRKEAVVKAHGMGLRIDLKSLDTAGECVHHPQLGNWQCHSISLHDGTIATQATAVLSLSWPKPRANTPETAAAIV